MGSVKLVSLTDKLSFLVDTNFFFNRDLSTKSSSLDKSRRESNSYFDLFLGPSRVEFVLFFTVFFCGFFWFCSSAHPYIRAGLDFGMFNIFYPSFSELFSAAVSGTWGLCDSASFLVGSSNSVYIDSLLTYSIFGASSVFFFIFIGLILCMFFYYYFTPTRFDLAYAGFKDMDIQLSVFIMACFFIVFLLYSSGFIAFFISWVGISISLYALIASRASSFKAQEAGTKYFILGLAITGFLLVGGIILYSLYGSLSFDALSYKLFTDLQDGWFIAEVAVFFVAVAFLFKLSAFPLYSWAPEVYDGTSWFVFSFLLLVVKPVFFLALCEFVSISAAFSFWAPLLCVAGVGSIVVGCLGCVVQQRLKRFLVFSSVANTGFLLVGVASEGGLFELSLGFLVSYILSSFLVILPFSFMYDARSTRFFRELAFISELRSLALSPTLSIFAVLLTAGLFSLAGLPPFLGFFAKLNLLMGGFSSHSFVVFSAAMVSVFLLPVSSFGYFRLVLSMYTLPDISRRSGRIVVSTPNIFLYAIYTVLGVVSVLPFCVYFL